jgi:carbamoyltransferase
LNILGIWDGHDSGAALLQNGGVRAAVNEERLTRRKLEIAFPARSIDACLAAADLAPEQIDLVAATTTDPAKTLGRLWPGSKERYYAVRRRKAFPGPGARATRALKYRMTEWAPGPISTRISRVALARTLSRSGLSGAALQIVDHHRAHAAAAAWTSGFDECAVITIDGLGDGLSATISRFEHGHLTRVAGSPARASVGVFFEHVTNLLNMRELEDEGKVMALADYAAPIDDRSNPLIPLLRVENGVIHTARPGHALRPLLARVHWQYANEQFAYLAQRAVEHAVVELARDAVRLTGKTHVALAGGVASNVKATRRIRLMPEVSAVFVFPHMGDGGLPLGAAIEAASSAGEPLRADMLQHLDLGPSYDDAAIDSAIRAAGLRACRPADLPGSVASLLSDGRVVMWFQGGMEYGPRALGHRSVLARPDRAELRDRLNLVLKRRVWYQPFCPTMLESEAVRLLADWDGGRNRSMTMAYVVADEERHRLAGVISVDGTCRPQFVADDESGPFAGLLRAVKQRWGTGVVLNTSFNIHGEPLVCSPADAVDVFVRSGSDALAMGPFLVERPA